MKIALKIVALVAIAFAAACGSAPTPIAETKPGNAGRAVRDDLDNLVVLPDTVTRAVSLAPNLTEIVFAVGAGDRLVGVTSYCNFPAETASIQKVGDTLKPNIESIIALKPDVVFVSTASQLETFTKTLNEQKIAVFVTNPNSLEGIYKSIEKIGAVFKSQSAGKLIADLKARVEAVESKTAKATKPKVLVQLDKSLFTIGRDSYLTDLVARAGGISATANIEKAYAQLSKESALALDPEVIILSDSSDNKEPSDVFRNSRALKGGRVYRIDADVMSRPGPRAVDALEQIAAALHPEIFKK
ncbi:MAG: ABC transporter substrate-binding protein [Acidobacteria bacterium]|nr:ABC transporter substrate-binding protein [Acidobacteriota bacterium]